MKLSRLTSEIRGPSFCADAGLSLLGLYSGKIESKMLTLKLKSCKLKPRYIMPKSFVFLFQVYVLDKKLLDPRRPKGKPTAYDQAELLIPYDPEIGFAPQAYATHALQVAKISGGEQTMRFIHPLQYPN